MSFIDTDAYFGYVFVVFIIISVLFLIIFLLSFPSSCRPCRPPPEVPKSNIALADALQELAHNCRNQIQAKMYGVAAEAIASCTKEIESSKDVMHINRIGESTRAEIDKIINNKHATQFRFARGGAVTGKNE